MTDQAFDIKASSFTLTILQLKTWDVALIGAQLAATFEKVPIFLIIRPLFLMPIGCNPLSVRSNFIV
jgi:hypothetical protein